MKNDLARRVPSPAFQLLWQTRSIDSAAAIAPLSAGEFTSSIVNGKSDQGYSFASSGIGTEEPELMPIEAPATISSRPCQGCDYR
jgi:hypothetical protein